MHIINKEMSEIFTYICISKFFHWKFTRIRKYNKLLIIVIYSLLKKNSMNIKIIFIFLSFYLIRFISTLNSLTEKKNSKRRSVTLRIRRVFRTLLRRESSFIGSFDSDFSHVITRIQSFFLSI